MSFSIRAYEPADHIGVSRLIEDVLAEFGFKPSMGGLERDLAELRERYGGTRAGFWVATRADAVIGTVAVRPKDSLTCELKRLYVRADFRGYGLGQALYEQAESFARAAGYSRIFLDSSRRFGKAHRLYERNGFLLLSQLHNEWEDNEYEKHLT
jgi:GNAT superfamily N-acetyltransferase